MAWIVGILHADCKCCFLWPSSQVPDQGMGLVQSHFPALGGLVGGTALCLTSQPSALPPQYSLCAVVHVWSSHCRDLLSQLSAHASQAVLLHLNAT